MSQRELAKVLGVSLGKTNYCIKALLDKGFIKVQNFRNSNNKLAYAYLLTPLGVEQKARMTMEFLKIKMREYERLRAEIAELKRESEQKADHE
jgi:EPS-associated MarR family transcriptional regulator